MLFQCLERIKKLRG